LQNFPDNVKAVLAEDEEFLRALVRTALQEVLEAEMTEALGAEKGERASGRQGYRSGYYGRTLVTRVGKLNVEILGRTAQRHRQRARVPAGLSGHLAPTRHELFWPAGTRARRCR
jgi:transposase-like protein